MMSGREVHQGRIPPIGATLSRTGGLQEAPSRAATGPPLSPGDALSSTPDDADAAAAISKIYKLLKSAQESERKAVAVLVAAQPEARPVAGSECVAIVHGCGTGTAMPSAAAPLSGDKRHGVKETPSSTAIAQRVADLAKFVAENSAKTDVAMAALDGMLAGLGIHIGSSATGAPTPISEPRVLGADAPTGTSDHHDDSSDPDHSHARGGIQFVPPVMHVPSAESQSPPDSVGDAQAVLEELQATLFLESSPPAIGMLEIEALVLTSCPDVDDIV